MVGTFFCGATRSIRSLYLDAIFCGEKIRSAVQVQKQLPRDRQGSFHLNRCTHSRMCCFEWAILPVCQHRHGGLNDFHGTEPYILEFSESREWLVVLVTELK